LGISNTTAGRKSMGIGSSNYAFGTKSAGIGMNNYSMGYETLAIGHYAVAGSEDPSKIDQVKYAAAIGNRAKSTITDAVAIGSFSNTTRDKGDYGYNPALGKAVTDTDITDDANIGTYRTELENARAAWHTSMEKAEELLHKIHTQQFANQAEHQQWNAEYDRLNADADAKMAAYDAAQKKVSDLVGAWQGQMAALSVGDENTGRTRQITGVAAGSADTDAVNVAQLKAIDRKLAQGAVHYYSVTSDKKATGSNFDNDGAKADDSMVIGIGSTSEGINSTVVGNNNTLKGGKRDSDGVRRNNSIVVGESLEVEGTHNAVFGTDYRNPDRKLTKVAGDQNTVIGVGNLVGYTAEKDNSDPRNPKWTYTKKSIGSNKNVAIGLTNTVNGGSVVLGTSSEIKDGATLATSVGHANTIQGSDQYGLALGNKLLVEGYGAIAVGTESKATADDATAIGTEAVAEQAGSIAFGHAAEAKNEYSIAFGLFAKAKARSGVAIGSSSLADREKGSIGYLAGENTSEVWKATKGAISVGNKEKKYTRQITGVAAGSADTDAVNVAQLKAVESKITQTGTEAQKHTSVAAGTNISVTEDGTNNEGGKNYKVSLAKDIDLGADGSIKAGNTTINNDGLTVQGGPSVTAKGIDAGSKVITNVAAGKADTDAVNVSQLKAVQEIAAAKTTIEAGDNIKVEKGSAKGSYKISATDTTLQKGNNALSLNGSKLNLSVKDTKGNEVTGSVDLEDLKGAVNTDTTYTLESEENDNNTTTIFLKGSDKKEQQVTVATKDTRNTIVDSDTVTVEAKAQEDGSNEYKLNVKTDGKVAKDNKGIVTGGTVYNETRIENDGNYIKAGNTAGQNLIALDKQVGANTTNIAELNNRVYDMGNRVDRVGAGAAALAGLHPLDFDPDDKWDFAAGYGNYKGAHALAIGAFYRPNESKMFSVGGSFGGGENMLNIGFSMKVGRGNEYMKLSRSEMAQQLDAQAKKLDEQAQKLDAQTQKLDAQDEQIRDMQAEMKAITQKLETLQARSGK
ncbi:MAG: YadA-like family protein, partial [Negativicoccus succinicivorans]|nr:YadA-like family protein [Negativicoccus succinicivorans]